MISMVEESMRAGQLVGQLVTAKKLWRVNRVFGVVWRAEFEHFVDTLFTVETVVYSGERNISWRWNII